MNLKAWLRTLPAKTTQSYGPKHLGGSEVAETYRVSFLLTILSFYKI